MPRRDGPAGRAGPADRAESADRTKPADRAESAGRVESADRAAPVDPRVGGSARAAAVPPSVEPEVALPVLPAPDSDGPADISAAKDSAATAALARARRAAAARGARPGGSVGRRRRGARATRPATYSTAGADDRDPALLGDQLDRLVADRGWRVDVAAGAVMARWPVIVGADIARHVTPVAFGDGVLTVRADSTAWATQMRYLSSTVLSRIDVEVGAGQVRQLRVTGPSAPSWRRGPRRTTDGVGPRDTYG